MELNFIKGHMGGNTIVFLNGVQIEKGKELETALRVLSGEYLGSHEACILYPPENGGDIKVKIVGRASKRFISACGGMTQVLGHILVETDFLSYYGVSVEKGRKRKVLLETDAGIVEILIDFDEQGKAHVITNMNSFLQEIYEKGITQLTLCGVEALRVGKFLVLNADNVKTVFRDVNFETMDEKTKEVLVKIQKEFFKAYMSNAFDFALYDLHPKRGGDIRAVFPHDITSGLIEPSCGTGSVAIGVAISYNGELSKLIGKSQNEKISVKLILETGGGSELGGPERTTVYLSTAGPNVEEISFSHSFVQVTAVGQVLL